MSEEKPMNAAVTDFHSHILPGIDDGSPDVKTSLQMLRMARDQGVTLQLLTPHYYPWKESIESFLSRRAACWEDLRGALTPELPELRLCAETAFFNHMHRMDLRPLCAQGTNVLLIELPFERWDSWVVDEIAALSLDQGYQVVLAHVERYMGYRDNPATLENLAQLPIFLQVNAEAFQHFTDRRRVLALARSGKPLLLGSDAHNLSNRSPNLAAGRHSIGKHLGSAYLQGMDEAAAALLLGETAAR